MAQPKPTAPAAEEEAPPPKSKKKLFIILGVVLVLLLGGGGAAAYFLLKPPPPKDEEVKEVKVEKLPVFLPIESFTLNLQPDTDQQSKYLQVAMSLQMPTDKDASKIKERMPEVRNRILMTLTNKKASEIFTVEGKEVLITELVEQLNKPYVGSEAEQNVQGIFFTSFIIQ